MDPGAADSVIVLPWNDTAAFETAIAEDAESIAAVIADLRLWTARS
jgi:glutamate-1-semialdehyde aminotransferase